MTCWKFRKIVKALLLKCGFLKILRKRVVGEEQSRAALDYLTEMLRIKFQGSVIFFMIFLKFLACTSLKNYWKNVENFPRTPKYDAKYCFWKSLVKFAFVVCCANENREDDGWQHILFQFVSSTKFHEIIHFLRFWYRILETGRYIWNLLLT